ncbi:tripartite motif-containing protein 3-like [Pecten maximus]|uniref:tripartite motif-containing protein 3-like n=1 Tax=Pecten maximus TaxID=6579 RepID=UPI001458671A|nr:tripartite motif-containing protein 3-like [Pecten maximus]
MEGEAVRTLITCPICRNVKRFAKKLQCQHSFCASCIADYMCSFTGKVSFPCPVCQCGNAGVDETVDITDSFQLPEDVFIQKLCDGANISNTGTSNQPECPVHPGNTMSYFCMQCDTSLCETCRSEHQHGTSCQVLDIQENADTIQEVSAQKSESLKYTLGQATVELCSIESALQPKEQAIVSSKEVTKDKVKAYYAEILENVTLYLQTQEQKVLSHLDEVIKKETDYILQRLIVTSSLLTSLQQRKDVLAHIMENTGKALSQAESLNMKMHMMNNVADYKTVIQDLKSASMKDLTLRFMINTDLEDMLTECDLVKIELLNSCHSDPIPAMFNTPNASRQNDQNGQRNRLSDRQDQRRVQIQSHDPNLTDRGRSENSRSSGVRSGSTERRPRTNDRRQNLPPYSAEGRHSENRGLKPPNRGSRPRPRSKSPRGIPDDIGPPPPYSPDLIEIDMPTPGRQSRRPKPSAPPMPNQQTSIGPFRRPPPVAMTIPKVGVLVPHERVIPQITEKISNVQYQHMLDSKANGDTRTPRIIGIAVIGRRFILADKWNNNLKIISKDNRRIEQVVPCQSFQPWDIASYAVGRCVVAAPREKILVFVGRARHTSQIQVVGKLSVPARYASITYFTRDDNFICGICPPYGGPSIDILTTTGVVLRSFQSDSFGKPLFTYPRNISVTDEGTIVVCDLDTRSVILVNADNGMYKMFSGNEQVQLQDPQCVEVLESHQLVLVLNSKVRKLIALSFSGDVIQQVDDVPVLDNARRLVTYDNNLVFVHQDGAVTFYTFE